MLGTIVLLVIVECLLAVMASYALERHAVRPAAAAGDEAGRARPR